RRPGGASDRNPVRGGAHRGSAPVPGARGSKRVRAPPRPEGNGRAHARRPRTDRPEALTTPGGTALRAPPPRELRALGGSGPGGPGCRRAVGAAAMSEADVGATWAFELVVAPVAFA